VKIIAYTRTALRALRRHRNMAARITGKIEDHAAEPEPLVNIVTDQIAKDCRRLRIGDFRVLFRETPTQIIVLDIGPRGSVYD
jgi:mRNA interferase RelE/StbE